MTPIDYFEINFFQHRTLQTTLFDIFELALKVAFTTKERVKLREEPLYRATRALVKDLDKKEDLQNTHYHNTRHFGDALLAAAILARFEPGLSYQRTLELIATMAAHDLGHDGTVNSPGNNLEQNSVKLFAVYMRAANVSPSQEETITRAILSTDPDKAHQNRLAYAALKSAADLPADRDAELAALAHDADLFGSISPRSGLVLSKALSDEWHCIGHPQAKLVSTFSGREKFLEHAKPITQAAESVGLGSARTVQLDALARLSASVLDTMPKPQADELYISTSETLTAKKVAGLISFNPV